MDRSAERPYLLDVLGRVADDRLEFTWSYSREVHRRETVARLAAELADELRAIVRHCAEGGAGGDTLPTSRSHRWTRRRSTGSSAAERTSRTCIRSRPPRPGW
ncbi:non-ribosomal peptide synthetase [Streptomyces canarius]